MGRMSGPMLAPDQIDATAELDRRAAAPPAHGAGRHGRRRARPGAVQRRRARGLRRPATAGRSLTNNQTVDVGTGGTFQVPVAASASARAGRSCTTAARRRWRDRFSDTACGGGDHGAASAARADATAESPT